MNNGVNINWRKIFVMVSMVLGLVWFENCSGPGDAASSNASTSVSGGASIAMLTNTTPPQIASYATPLTIQFDGVYTGVSGDTPINLTYIFTLNVATGAVVDALGNTDYFLTSTEMGQLLGMLNNSVYANFSQIKQLQGLPDIVCDLPAGSVIFPYAVVATDSAGSINLWDWCASAGDLYNLSTFQLVGMDTFLTTVAGEAEAAKGNIASIAILTNTSPPQIASYAIPLTIQFDGSYTGVSGNTPIGLTYLFTLNVATGAVANALGNIVYNLTSIEASQLLGMLSNDVYANYGQILQLQGQLGGIACDPGPGAIFPYAVVATDSAGSINLGDWCPNVPNLYNLSTLSTHQAVGLDTFLTTVAAEAEAAEGN